MTDYASRLRVPLAGDASRRFFTRSGVLIAIGYDRVVIGERGPYVEFSSRHVMQERLRETDTDHWYYVELRTEPDDVKVYFQMHLVGYADYVPGKLYVSPFELYDDAGSVLIEPLRC